MVGISGDVEMCLFIIIHAMHCTNIVFSKHSHGDKEILIILSSQNLLLSTKHIRQ